MTTFSIRAKNINVKRRWGKPKGGGGKAEILKAESGKAGKRKRGEAKAKLEALGFGLWALGKAKKRDY
jgi:hypothetical protein